MALGDKTAEKKPPALAAKLAKHALPIIGGKISAGAIAGLFFVLTGFSPEEWFRRTLASLNLPAKAMGWASYIDLRLALVAFGVALVVGDMIWQRRRAAEAVPRAPNSSTSPQAGHDLPVEIPDQPALPLPNKPSLAVLPFHNASGDPEQDYFADGMVEEITTALTRVKWFFVIARNSSFTYKGRAVDVRQVGRELGVRYVLQGSVRKSGERVRITGQLVETETGNQVWADRFEEDFKNIFDLQDQVTERVVGAIEPTLQAAEVKRGNVGSTDNLDAYELYLRALACYYEMTNASTAEASALIAKALAVDPSYRFAHAFASAICVFRGLQGWATQEEIKVAQVHAQAALAGATDEPLTLAYAASAAAYLSRDFEVAAANMDRAVRLNPNSARILILSAWLKNWMSDPDGAIAEFERAIRLSPLDPETGYMLTGIAFAHIIKDDYRQAACYARKATGEMPHHPPGWAALAISAQANGELYEARRAVRRLSELSSGHQVHRNPWRDAATSEKIIRYIKTAAAS